MTLVKHDDGKSNGSTLTFHGPMMILGDFSLKRHTREQGSIIHPEEENRMMVKNRSRGMRSMAAAAAIKNRSRRRRSGRKALKRRFMMSK